MTYISDSLRRQVTQRANDCCEYCLIPPGFQMVNPHEVDHVIAEKHRGKTALENLCLSCYDCNRFKGSDICSLDPEDETLTRLFNPEWIAGWNISNSSMASLNRVLESVVSLPSFWI
jgi:5-methylcytosine-specific restriction endonuclease McrA